MLDRELKKGSAELIILSIIEPGARHGYEISKLIETRSAGSPNSTSPRFTPFYTGWKNVAGCRENGLRSRASGRADFTA